MELRLSIGLHDRYPRGFGEKERVNGKGPKARRWDKVLFQGTRKKLLEPAASADELHHTDASTIRKFLVYHTLDSNVPLHQIDIVFI
jgi:hypothetical protein